MFELTRTDPSRPTIPSVEFFLDDNFKSSLESLPWQSAIVDWKNLGVKLLDIKRGVGRHPLVFVESHGRQFVVKQLSVEGARRENRTYRRLLEMGIHTLLPVGHVIRKEGVLSVPTRIGQQFEPNVIGYSVTVLMDRVLPDSLLYRRAFKFENRKRIWDSIANLFVELHRNGVFWGDASLANTLVKFLKVEVPYIGKRTELKAFLADAETVEIHDSISDSMRAADVSFFLESMDWMNEDLRASGMLRDNLATAQDKSYIQTQYEKLFAVSQRAREFEKLSSLNIAAYLGHVREPVYFDTLEKHIAEHKWYMSEEQKSEVTFAIAARDWLQTVFEPVCELFRQEGVLRFFPGKTASELYVEIMTHKYFLSLTHGKDVGLLRAMREYAEKYGHEPPLTSFWRNLTLKMKDILGFGGKVVLGVIE